MGCKRTEGQRSEQHKAMVSFRESYLANCHEVATTAGTTSATTMEKDVNYRECHQHRDSIDDKMSALGFGGCGLNSILTHTDTHRHTHLVLKQSSTSLTLLLGWNGFGVVLYLSYI